MQAPQPRDRQAGKCLGHTEPQSSEGAGEEGEEGVSGEVTSPRELHSQGAIPEGGDDFSLNHMKRAVMKEDI